ncbi:uncharacterized protein LOC142534150 [Primulina tabacum]
MAMLHCYTDRIKCKVFLTTLVDSAQRWFEGLAPQSISYFKDFQKLFSHHFSSSKKYKKTAFSFFEVKQSPEKSLRAYIRRFNRVALDVPTCATETKTTAFTQGLREGEFFKSLTKMPGNFEDLLSRAEKYINMEEAQKQKRGCKKEERTGYLSPRRGGKREGNYALPSILGPSHNNQRPRLPPWTSRKPGSSARGRGGSTDGDSNRARKSRSRRECMEVEGARRNEAVISFGPEDLIGVNLPHSDTLVIQARVANYDILRVFVDSGSSVNVIFKDVFAQMDLQGFHLEAVETALFGFAGHVVYPEGEIVLPLTLGSQDLKKTVMTSFTVVDSPSSYNIILGRPAMNELRAVASTYHLKIKFHVGARVGEVRGDQPSSRKCYVEQSGLIRAKPREKGRRKGWMKLEEEWWRKGKYIL